MRPELRKREDLAEPGPDRRRCALLRETPSRGSDHRRSGTAGRLTAMALAALAITGCAAGPRGAMLPVGVTVPGATPVDLLVATTRAPSPDPGILFSGERGTALALTNVVVSVPPDSARQRGTVEIPRTSPGNPATDFVVLTRHQLNDAQTRSWFARRSGRSRSLLIFVHGYNNFYEDAVFRFAQVIHDSGINAAPLLFTWPSRGSALAYPYDKESATYSRDALEQILRHAVASPAVSDITVLAHSMGAWLAVESVRQLAIRNGRVPAKIRNVVLASPDIDVDVFRQQVVAMGRSRPRITVFVSRDDRALALATSLSGGVDRLGAVDYAREPYRTELQQTGVTLVDLSELRGSDPLNHAKFADSPDVVQLLGRVIDGQRLDGAAPALGDGLQGVAVGGIRIVGGLAEAVVTAPAAILTPRR